MFLPISCLIEMYFLFILSGKIWKGLEYSVKIPNSTRYVTQASINPLPHEEKEFT